MSQEPSSRDRLAAAASPLLLVAAILAGATLRLYNLNWDQGYLFHPDERMILMTVGGMGLPWPPDVSLLLSADSPLNPHFFAYGSLPLYLLKAVAHLLSLLKPGLSEFGSLSVIGRGISGVFDTAVIALVFALGARLYGRAVGLLSAALVAFTVLHIQLSHFYTVDTLLTFFIVLAMLCAVEVARHGSLKAGAALGICLGLALATKVSVAPFALTVAMAWLLWRVRGEADPDAPRRSWSRAILGASVAGLLALLVFVLGEPYAVIDWQNFVKRVFEESNMVRGVSDLPYTRQYIGTPAYLYQIWNTSAWATGIPLGIVGFGGLLWALVRGVLRRRVEELLLLSWVLVYFLINGSFMVKFLRYMLPILPFLCILGAAAIVSLKDWLASHSRRLSRAVMPTAVVLVVLPTLLYSLAFVNVYAQEHPWIQVSRWMYQNLSARSVIATEHWDDRMPLGMTLDGKYRNAESFGHKDMANYEEDNAVKLNWMIDNIRASDVIVLATNRLYGSIARLPDRYPLTTAYYEFLFSGRLGFRLTGYAATYPSLLGVTIVDDTFSDPKLPVPEPLASTQVSPMVINLGRADESFTVYDHPKPLVFQKERQLSADELRALFEPAMRRVEELRQQRSAQEAAARGQAGTGSGKTLLLSEADRQVQEAGGTFSEMFDPASLENQAPVLVWWLAVTLLGLLAFPISFAACRGLDDRGYFAARALGVLLLGYPVWLAASLRVLPYTRLTIALALILLALVSAVLYRRQWGAIREFLRTSRRLVLWGEGLFLAGFLAFCYLRVLNPDLWQPWLGGEKPMEFAFLNAIIRSTCFPPFDPYFAGGTINYYYYGQYLVATLIKLTGILPSVAFNVAVPSLFALTLTGVFGVTYNLVGRFGRGTRRIGFSLLSALFVAVAGNLDGLVQVANSLAKNSTVAFKSAIPGLEGLVRLVTGLVVTVVQRVPIAGFDYWGATRVIPNTINEFPFFSFLFADLHPHMIGLPFTLLVLVLCLNVALPPKRTADAHGETAGRLATILLALLLALSLGALVAINSWDLPTYLGILACSLAIRDWVRFRRVRLVATAGAFGFITAASLLLYLPFFQSYQALYVGLGLTTARTSLADFWHIFGFFTFIIASVLLLDAWHTPWALSRIARFLARRWDGLPRAWRLTRTLGVAEAEAPAGFAAAAPDAAPRRQVPWGLWTVGWVIVAALALAVAGYHLMAVLLPLLVLVVALALRRGAGPQALFTGLLIFTGLLLSMGVEVVYLRDFLGGGDYQRMNTIFKFYMQIWVLLGMAAGVCLASLVQRRAPASPKCRRASAPGWLPAAWWTVFAVLLLAVIIYPVAGTAARVSDRFPGARPAIGTLDGMAFMSVGTYTWENKTIELGYDYDAIQWLLINVKGSPVVAEAAIGYYREFGVRVASFTGLPTLLGMHQSEQRYDTQVGARDGEARTLFSEPDYARVVELVRRLRIKYIYVGQLERIVYPAAGLAKFDRAVGTYLDVVYENSRTKIYAVR